MCCEDTEQYAGTLLEDVKIGTVNGRYVDMMTYNYTFMFILYFEEILAQMQAETCRRMSMQPGLCGSH